MTEAGIQLKVEDRLHNVKEVATIFSVEPATVRVWIKTGHRGTKLGAMKVGKSWRISRDAMVIFANSWSAS